MSQTVTRIAPLSAARIFGVIYFLLGLLFMPLMALPALLSGQGGASPFPLAIAVGMPVLQGVFGFVGTAAFAGLYNVLAARLGGVELQLAVTVDGAGGSDG